MTQAKDFNPIKTAHKIEDSYREYIASTIHFDDVELQSQLEEILRKPGYLAKGPFLEATPPYRKDKTVAELVKEGVLCNGMLKLGGGNPQKFDPRRPLYVHQVKAIRKALAGRNYAVVTGTGSGKTECFLLPILNDILKEFEEKGSSSGIRAMILYPMNALANDQLKRLRTLLEGTDITFGRYTGDTEETEREALSKWKEENPSQTKLPNEIISREKIRENPPNILLTNYSMLEYLLLRPEDAPLFGKAFGTNWRHIAIDEAHVYSGALGTEIAFLLRRLKARIESETERLPKIQCYATSATIGSKEDMPKVAAFAQDLFGEPFSGDPGDIDVITSENDSPQDALQENIWGKLNLSTWPKLRKVLYNSELATGHDIREALSQEKLPESIVSQITDDDPLMGLGKVLLGEDSTSKIVKQCTNLLDLTDLNSIESLGIDGLTGDNDGIDILTAMVEVLSSAQRSKDIPILTSRFHSFLRAPEGIFLNLNTRKLIPEKTITEDYDGENKTPVYEASVCRHCGQAYILGDEESVNELSTAWLNPSHKGIDSDDEFLPRTYYRVLTDESERDPDEEVQWLCPICGSLHNEAHDGVHCFNHIATSRIPIALNKIESNRANEETARCRHCGYRSRNAIQPMRISPEAAGSVVCYELVREIPPFEIEEPNEEDWFTDPGNDRRAGNVICFSDKRQDAAFFAPAMERTYGSITRRQLIREAVEDLSRDEGYCKPSRVIRWIEENVDKRYSDFPDETDNKDVATALILDELSAEDSRNSLEGLGVIRIEPTKFNEGFKDPKVQQRIECRIDKLNDAGITWLTKDDYITLVKVCLEFLRERNAIKVPAGIADLRKNHEPLGNWVVLGDEESPSLKQAIRFAGTSSNKSENKRSIFVRKYAKKIYGIDISQSESRLILQELYAFMVQYLGKYFKKNAYLTDEQDAQKFRLNKDIWSMFPHADDDIIYRCNSCGCATHLDTRGVCPTMKCNGTMEQTTFVELSKKNRYFKKAYQEDALPINIQEHTAQLSTKEAREIQSGFIMGDVNILSCTTTFELGVDVGDLRAIFMRNVPPRTANYTQRAGRVGRRAGKPGYAITFARLRPHDIAQFNNPTKIIAGDTHVPICYLDNEAIAIRHVFAVVLSEFFRYAAAKFGKDYSHEYHAFMDLSKIEPDGLKELRAFLNSHPKSIFKQLQRIIPEDLPVAKELGIDGWDWIPRLVDPIGWIDGKDHGRLLQAHSLKHDDFQRIQESIELYKSENDINRVAGLYNSIKALEKEKTISILAENGILPKYGFPTDLVELHIPEMQQGNNESKLSLSRGMRQAIREYAPGSEIIAGKTLWESIGIKRPKNQKLQERRYGKCPNCETFVWPIENYDGEGECPACHKKFNLESKVLIPSYGFIGKRSKKDIGLRKPRSKGYTTIHFSQHWPNEVNTTEITFPGGTVITRYAGNGQLCVLNEPSSGFRVCERCYSAAIGGEEIPHADWCKHSDGAPKYKHYNALGASFVSDVLEFVFELEDHSTFAKEDWEAVMWALFAAATKILEIPETELGGTMYDTEKGGMALLLYDDVPGGAGHAYQLSNRVQELLEEAYKVVDGHCGCGDETCCYGCIANYYNQTRQAKLSRGAAKEILETLLNPAASLCPETKITERAEIGTPECKPTHFFVSDNSPSLGALSLTEAVELSIHSDSSEEWKDLIRSIIKLCSQTHKETPDKDVEVFGSEDASAYATLVWRKSKVILLDEDAFTDFQEEFESIGDNIDGWSIFVVGACTAENVVSKLTEVA